MLLQNQQLGKKNLRKFSRYSHIRVKIFSLTQHWVMMSLDIQYLNMRRNEHLDMSDQYVIWLKFYFIKNPKHERNRSLNFLSLIIGLKIKIYLILSFLFNLVSRPVWIKYPNHTSYFTFYFYLSFDICIRKLSEALA